MLASIFAVSRMLAMLTEMHLVPHSHFGMPGSIQKHTLVYTVVLGLFLTVFFDLSRIAALGVIFYLIMDIAIHWGGYCGICERILRPVVGPRNRYSARCNRVDRVCLDKTQFRSFCKRSGYCLYDADRYWRVFVPAFCIEKACNTST